MNKHRLQAELWEIQFWLMGILAFLILHFGQNGVLRFLGWLIVAHMFITAVGVFKKLKKSRKEDPDF